jgi:hypothetical protein
MHQEVQPHQIVPSNNQELRKTMEWIPIVLVTFKVLVLGTGMFYAIKWHYDQGRKEKERHKEKRALLRAGGQPQPSCFRCWAWGSSLSSSAGRSVWTLRSHDG